MPTYLNNTQVFIPTAKSLASLDVVDIITNGIPFNEALKKAQELGFAEADPTADLEGFDMMRKIAILSDLAWNTKVDINLINHKSFTSVTDEDIKQAIKENKVIKYVCESELIDDKINISVYPKVFDKTHLFANVNYEVNAVILET